MYGLFITVKFSLYLQKNLGVRKKGEFLEFRITDSAFKQAERNLKNPSILHLHKLVNKGGKNVKSSSSHFLIQHFQPHRSLVHLFILRGDICAAQQVFF